MCAKNKRVVRFDTGFYLLLYGIEGCRCCQASFNNCTKTKVFFLFFVVSGFIIVFLPRHFFDGQVYKQNKSKRL